MNTQRFSTRAVLSVINDLGEIDLDHDRLKDWHRRGVLHGEAAGKGHERTYGLEEVVFIASLAMFADRTRYLRQACKAAEWHTAKVLEALKDQKSIATAPAYLMTHSHDPQFQEIKPADYPARKLGLAYASNAAVLVHPAQFAILLRVGLDEQVAE